MSTIRVKICGLTEESDLIHACAAGADAVGFVFYEPSNRFVDKGKAAKLSSATPPFVQRVGLFVNASKAYVNEVISAVELDLLQFHGEESAEFCESFSLPYIKAIAAKENQNLVARMDQYPNARGFLIDTFIPGQPGGTGKTFNWDLFPSYHKPLILAGGLTAENVKSAIDQLAPYAVDVSGGVEFKPGKKSDEHVTAFIHAVKY